MLSWLKQLLRRRPVVERLGFPPSVPDVETTSPDDHPTWCVVANVLIERPYGPGGAEKRRGTKHFAPGAKVYVYEFFWGVAGETVSVIGRHRKSHRWIRLTMDAKHLANWRTELVYSPHIAKQIRETGELARWPESERARRAEEIVAHYIKHGAPTQPYITRPPTAP